MNNKTYTELADEFKDPEFEKFYDANIAPLLNTIDAKRKVADGWGISMLVSGISCFGLFICIQTDIIGSSLFAPLFTLGVIIFIVSIYFYAEKNDAFSENYKSVIIKEIIAHINPGFVYKPNENIDADDYVKSSLFRYKYDYYDGDDLIEGVYKGVHFCCSELHTRYDTGRTQSTIFKGLFFRFTISNFYSGCTYVWPTGNEQLADSIMNEYYRLFPMPDVAYVECNDNDFGKHFSIYSTYSAEAYDLFNTERRNRLLKFKYFMRRPISVSVVESNIYVAMPFNEDLLEPSEYFPEEKVTALYYHKIAHLGPEIIDRLMLDTLQ